MLNGYHRQGGTVALSGLWPSTRLLWIRPTAAAKRSGLAAAVAVDVAQLRMEGGVCWV